MPRTWARLFAKGAFSVLFKPAPFTRAINSTPDTRHPTPDTPPDNKGANNKQSQQTQEDEHSVMSEPPSPSSTASDEDSVKLVWQDDGGADLKSLFAKNMMSMTQQIDGWGDSDDDEEEDGEGDIDKTRENEGYSNTNQNIENKRADSADNRNKSSAKKQRKRSLPKNQKIGQNLTPPPSSGNVVSRALHSDETPATISKLKRKRRKGVRSKKDYNCKSLGAENCEGIVDNGSDEKKLKISASQEVDRVFDFLGLPEHQHKQQECTQPDSTGSALKIALETRSGPGVSPMPCGRLFGRDSNKPAAKQITRRRLRERQQLKLPPLRPDKENIAIRQESVEDLFKEIEMGLDCATKSQHGAAEGNITADKQSTTSDGVASVPTNPHDIIPPVAAANKTSDDTATRAAQSEPKCQNLSVIRYLKSLQAKIIQPPSHTIATSQATNKLNDHKSQAARKKGVPGALQPAVGINTNQGSPWNSGLRKSKTSTHVNPKPIATKQNALANPTATSKTVQTTSSNPASLTNQRNNKQKTTKELDDSEFDDDWDDEDLAAIDKCIAMTQCKTSNNILADSEFDDGLDDDLAAVDIPRQPSKPDDEFEDEFGDDDDEFAALDLSGVMTQSDAHILNSFASSFGGIDNPALVSNVSSANTSEFSDDDDEFAEMDFKAIDNKIAQKASQPSRHIPTHNRRSNNNDNRLCFTRYIVRSVEDNFATSTKTLGVALWNINEAKSKSTDELECLRMYQEDQLGIIANTITSLDGFIHLRGIWYYSKCCVGDVIHLISISGSYATDLTALPVILDSVQVPNGNDTQDDLVLVIHPDELITPTLISEAVTCPRLAVLQQRLGSTGLSARSAVTGTLRHELFERCLQEHTASRQAAAVFTRHIIRSNAESLVGCGITDQKYAFSEVMKTLPQIQNFLQTYTSWDGTKTGQMKLGNNNLLSELKGEFPSADTLLLIREIYSTEQMTMCPELGLKGYVDANVEAVMQPKQSSSGSRRTSLMPIELKTGHSQTLKNNHSAQLAVYTLALRSRHGTASANGAGHATELGAATSGMLLYLNDKSFNAFHIKPTLSDAKQLIGQRNDVACDSMRASRPRGIAIEYNEDARSSGTGQGSYKAVINPPPSNALPPMNPKSKECERCYKSRECMMYASASIDSIGQLNSGHRQISEHFTSHLNEPDLDYFRKWNRLIDLERHAASKDSSVKSWLIQSGEKEKADGTCISSLLLNKSSLMTKVDNGEAAAFEGRATLRFTKAGTNLPINNLSFECGNYVLLSADTPFLASKRDRTNKMHVLKGYVSEISEDGIEISVSKRDVRHVSRLCDESSNTELLFRLDKDEFSSGTGLLYQNLVNFLTLDIPSFSTESFGQTPSKTKSMTANTEDSRRRRRLQSCITQLNPPPRFCETLSITSLFDASSFSVRIPGCDMDILKTEFFQLNCDQRAAIHKVISAEDFALIQGLPGTGKSATVSFLSRLLVAQGKRVLLTSYTHSAVDNLFCKLLDSGLSDSMVRIGRESTCHLRVQSFLAQNLACVAEAASTNSTEPVKTPNANFLHNVVSSAKVVGVTALTAPKSPLLSGQHFDYVIVDEAGQINQPAILGAITCADKFILVGDHMQLPPLARSQVAEQAGWGVSMLSHLAEGFPESVAKLTMQYRMHEDIQSLSNIIAYAGLLKCGNDKVRSGLLQLKHYPTPQVSLIDPVDKSWLDHCISPTSPVVFIDTDGLSKGLEDMGPVNTVESTIAAKLVTAFSAAGLESSSIGIITPFRSQLRLFNENAVIYQGKLNGLESGTVDVFQGRDKPVIILSFVRSNQEGKAGRLLQDFRRLNVAFSRSKQKLIMVGSFSTLYSGSEVMRPVLDSIRQKNWVHNLTCMAN